MPTFADIFYMVRVGRIELPSQVWKTCILTAVLYPLDTIRDKTTFFLDARGKWFTFAPAALFP